MREKLFDYLENFMIHTNWLDEDTPEQARAIFTTLCLVGYVDADTSVCDNMLFELYNKSALDELIPYDEFARFMIKFIT